MTVRRSGTGKALGAVTGFCVVLCALMLVPNRADAAPIDVQPVAYATCDDAAYTLHWNIYNTSSAAVTVISAEQTGAATGTASFSPSTLSEGGGGNDHGIATTGPLPGDTTGTVTLTVQLQADVDLVTVTAEIPLGGFCAQQALPPPVAAVTPTTVGPNGTITVSGGQCPLAASWLKPQPFQVTVTLANEGPIPGSVRLPRDGFGTNVAATAVGVGIGAGPGGSIVTTTPDPLGNWTATLSLTTGTTPVPPGTYGVLAVCHIDVSPSSRITYQTPAITIRAPDVPRPVTATPAFTG